MIVSSHLNFQKIKEIKGKKKINNSRQVMSLDRTVVYIKVPVLAFHP